MTVHDAGDVVLNDVAVADHTVLRRPVLLGTSLALAPLEIFHPERPSPTGCQQCHKPPRHPSGTVGTASYIGTSKRVSTTVRIYPSR
jgi:hypothetical protein